MAFKLKSGNAPTFKQMGSSPLKHDLPGGEDHVHGTTDKETSFDTDTEIEDFTKWDDENYIVEKEKREPVIPIQEMKEDVKNVIGGIGDAASWVGKGISRAWRNRPRYKVRFNNSPMIPGFMSIKRK